MSTQWQRRLAKGYRTERLASERKAKLTTTRKESAVHIALGISTRKHRESAQRDFENYVRFTWGVEAPSKKIWGCDREDLEVLILDYFTDRLELSIPRSSRTGKYVSQLTLNQWRVCMVHCIATQVPDGEAWLVTDGFYSRLYQHIHFLSKKLKLVSLTREGDYIGQHEVRLMLEHLVAMAEDTEITLQEYMAVLLFFHAGVRPGSVGWTYKEWIDEGRYLKLKCIKIHREDEGRFAFSVHVSFEHLKGFNDTMSARIGVWLRPVTLGKNVIFDVGTALVCLLLSRGALMQYTTLDEVLAGRERDILIKPDMTEEPLIYGLQSGGRGVNRNLPASARQVSSTFADLTVAVGLRRTTPYGARRDALHDVSEAYDEAAATNLANHRGTTTFRKHYSRGTDAIDVVGARTGEPLVNTAKLTRARALAMGPGVGLRPSAAASLQRLSRSSDPLHIIAGAKKSQTRIAKEHIDKARDRKFKKEVERRMTAFKKSDTIVDLQKKIKKAIVAVERAIGGKIQKGGSNRTPIADQLEHKPVGLQAWNKLNGLRADVNSKRTVAKRIAKREAAKLFPEENIIPLEPEPLFTVDDVTERVAALDRPSAVLQVALLRSTTTNATVTANNTPPLPINESGTALRAGSEDPATAVPAAGLPSGNFFDGRAAFDESHDADIDIDVLDVNKTREAFAVLLMSCSDEASRKKVPYGVCSSSENGLRFRCIKCRDDGSVPEEKVNKEYTASDLALHIYGKYHHPQRMAWRYFRDGTVRDKNPRHVAGVCIFCIQGGRKGRRTAPYTASEAFKSHIRRLHSDYFHTAAKRQYSATFKAVTTRMEGRFSRLRMPAKVDTLYFIEHDLPVATTTNVSLCFSDKDTEACMVTRVEKNRVLRFV